MPWTNEFGIGRYRQPHVSAAISVDMSMIDAMNNKRKSLAKLRDELKSVQHLDKMIKECAREVHKDYQGVCYVLGVIMANPPGDCKVETNPDIAPYIDRAFNYMCWWLG